MLKTVIIFTLILILVFSLFMALPTIRIDKDTVISSNAFAYIRAACYFIPTGTCLAILGLFLGMQAFRIIVAIIRMLIDAGQFFK